MDHTVEIIGMIFISKHNSSEVLKPGKKALYFPSTSIRFQFASIFGEAQPFRHCVQRAIADRDRRNNVDVLQNAVWST
jgi:hypothetical protein